METIYFSKLKDPYGEFSNFYPVSLEINGKNYSSVENFYQSQKFAGTEWEEYIRMKLTAILAKEAAWKEELRPYIRKNWNEKKDFIMLEALKTKFRIPCFRNLLLSTGTAEIIELSEKDFYWGRNKKGLGYNMLGKMLMEIREGFRIEEQNKNKFIK